MSLTVRKIAMMIHPARRQRRLSHGVSVENPAAIPASYPDQPTSSGGGGGISSLLNIIGQAEAPQGYNQYYSGIRSSDGPPRPLTSMTVNEVLAWQDSIDPKYPSEAAGRYQVMEDTLRGLVRQGKVSGGMRFDQAGQDRIARILAEGRGLNDYQSGRISAEMFANNLAREWAGLPVATGSKAGRSYYDGDGLNSATVGVNQVLAAIRGL